MEVLSMPSVLRALNIFKRLVGATTKAVYAVTRTVLRGVISLATKIEASLPDIQETMEEIDPGASYAEWAQAYRSLKQGTQLEETLATWPKDKPVDGSVMTFQNHRRARKYRYIFTANVIDEKMGTNTWKMFSMYSKKELSPDEVLKTFQAGYFQDMYENNVRIDAIILKRVQKWTSQKAN
jgi:hypothetical protein